MSRNNQAKRAAKARARMGSPDHLFRTVPPAADARVVARNLILSIVPPERHTIETLVRLDQTIVRSVAAAVLDELLRRLYALGWLPDEVARASRTHGDSDAEHLSRWVIGAERAARISERVEPEWQLRWDRAEPITVRDQDWVADWQAGCAGTPAELMIDVVMLAHHWQRMPPLETLVPPPPGITPRDRPVGVRHRTETDPLLERVRALLAKAESTEYEAEASTFTAKAQELMTKYAIDAALLEHATPSHDQPGMIRVPLDPPYVDNKALLLQTVATHLRCRTLFMKEYQLSSVVGFASDLEGVELLFTSLLVQSHHALLEAIRGARPGSHQRSQQFKAAFLSGFSERIGVRLNEANRLAYTDERAGTFLPVLQSREERVEAMVEERFGARTSHRVRGGSSYEGYHQGQRAGDAAKLANGEVEQAG